MIKTIIASSTLVRGLVNICINKHRKTTGKKNKIEKRIINEGKTRLESKTWQTKTFFFLFQIEILHTKYKNEQSKLPKTVGYAKLYMSILNHKICISSAKYRVYTLPLSSKFKTASIWKFYISWYDLQHCPKLQMTLIYVQSANDWWIFDHMKIEKLLWFGRRIFLFIEKQTKDELIILINKNIHTL
jgi:hypothetical protein